MGALTRATRFALGEEDAEDTIAAICAGVCDRGPVYVKEYCQERVWAEGPVWDWIHADDERERRYQAAKRYKAEMRVGEALGVADGSGEPKLIVDTSFRYAAAAYPEAYGQRLKVERTTETLPDAGLVLAMGELLRRVRERTVPVELVVQGEEVKMTELPADQEPEFL